MVKSKRQRFVFWFGLAVFILLGIFPPWTQVNRFRGQIWSSVNLSYSFIALPPAPETDPDPDGRVTIPTVKIDGTRLMIGWVCVSVLTAGLIIGLGFQEKHKASAPGFRG